MANDICRKCGEKMTLLLLFHQCDYCDGLKKKEVPAVKWYTYLRTSVMENWEKEGDVKEISIITRLVSTESWDSSGGTYEDWGAYLISGADVVNPEITARGDMEAIVLATPFKTTAAKHWVEGIARFYKRIA
jgi:hypothetical protein